MNNSNKSRDLNKICWTRLLFSEATRCKKGFYSAHKTSMPWHGWSHMNRAASKER